MNNTVKQMAKQSGFNVETANEQFNGQIVFNCIDRLVASVVNRSCDIINGGHPVDVTIDMIKSEFGVE